MIHWMLLHGNDTPSDSDAATKTVWLLLAVALNTLELIIPRIPMLPWLKPGLANSITIIWIIRYGITDALFYTLLRIWISSFYFGFSLVTMALAVSGGVSATLAMGGLWYLLGRRGYCGTLGCAVTGAVFHNAGQLGAVYFLLTRNSVVFYQIPFMGVAALLFGTVIGSIVPLLWRILVMDAATLRRPVDHPLTKMSLRRPDTRTIILNSGIITGSAALVLVKSMPFLGAVAAAVTITAFLMLDRNPAVLFYPFRMWAMFLFVVLVYLFFSYGMRVPFFPLVTYEGLAETARQCLRLWTWLETGRILQRLQCNSVLFTALGRLFPGHAGTLISGLFALEYFPDVISFVKFKGARAGIDWRRPMQGIAEFTVRVQAHILELVG